MKGIAAYMSREPSARRNMTSTGQLTTPRWRPCGRLQPNTPKGSNQLGYSVLCADAPGVVASIGAEVGQVVSAGQSVVTLVRDGEREVEISIPENRIEELGKAQKITVVFWALPGVTVEGKSQGTISDSRESGQDIQSQN